MTLERAKEMAMKLHRKMGMDFFVIKFNRNFDVVTEGYFKKYGNYKRYFSTKELRMEEKDGSQES